MIAALGEALGAARAYRDSARTALAGRLARRKLDDEQRAAHGLAWVATSVAALEGVVSWLEANDGGTGLDRQIAWLAFAETIGQLTGG